MKFPLGVVLSGGSVRGAAHVGFLQRLKELGYKPDIISGSSAGAMVGAFYAAGKSTEEIMDFFTNTSLFRYNSINPLTPGIFDTAKYESIFKDFLPPRFEDLETPLIIATTNIEKGDPQYFSSGDLYKPLLASCAIPVVFAPVEIEGCLYVDGGVLDNFPVEQLIGKCEKIIGSFLGSPGAVDRKNVNSKMKITSRANELLMYAASRLKFPMTDCTIEHPLMQFGYFDQKKMNDIYQVGYEFCLKELKPDILEVA